MSDPGLNGVRSICTIKSWKNGIRLRKLMLHLYEEVTHADTPFFQLLFDSIDYDLPIRSTQGTGINRGPKLAWSPETKRAERAPPGFWEDPLEGLRLLRVVRENEREPLDPEQHGRAVRLVRRSRQSSSSTPRLGGQWTIKARRRRAPRRGSPSTGRRRRGTARAPPPTAARRRPRRRGRGRTASTPDGCSRPGGAGCA